jgi:hypothetical protein
MGESQSYFSISLSSWSPSEVMKCPDRTTSFYSKNNLHYRQTTSLRYYYRTLVSKYYQTTILCIWYYNLVSSQIANLSIFTSYTYYY